MDKKKSDFTGNQRKKKNGRTKDNNDNKVKATNTTGGDINRDQEILDLIDPKPSTSKMALKALARRIANEKQLEASLSSVAEQPTEPPTEPPTESPTESPSESPVEQLAVKQNTPHFLKPLGTYVHFERALPVTFQIFRTFTKWEEIVQGMVDEICRDNNFKKSLQSDPQFKEQLLENFYLDFYLDAAVRSKYSLNLKACPKHMKDTILSQPEICWNPKRQQKRDLSVENNNNERCDEKNKLSCSINDKLLEFLKKKPSDSNSDSIKHRGNVRIFGCTDHNLPSDALLVEYITSRVEDSHSHEKIIRELKKRLAERNSEMHTPKVNIISLEISNLNLNNELQSLALPKSGHKESEGVAGERFVEEDQATVTDAAATASAVDDLQEVKAEFFKMYEEDCTLSYLLKTSDISKQRIIELVLGMTLEDFAKWTRIYCYSDDIYNDKELLEQCYRFAIVNERIWPMNLFIPLGDFIEFLRERGYVLNSFELSSFSPKFLHWSDLIAFTNFDYCVRKDYLSGKTTTLIGVESLQALRVDYYRRCWIADSWLGQRLALTDEGLQEQVILNLIDDDDGSKEVSTGDCPTNIGDFSKKSPVPDDCDVIIDLTSDGSDSDNEAVATVSSQESMMNPDDPVERALFSLFSDKRKTPASRVSPSRPIIKAALHAESRREVAPQSQIQLSTSFLRSSVVDPDQPLHVSGNSISQESTETAGASNGSTVSGSGHFNGVATGVDETTPRGPSMLAAGSGRDVTTAKTATHHIEVKTEPKPLNNERFTLNDDGDIVVCENLSEDAFRIDTESSPKLTLDCFDHNYSLMPGRLPSRTESPNENNDNAGNSEEVELGTGGTNSRKRKCFELFNGVWDISLKKKPAPNEWKRQRLTEEYVPQMRHTFRPLPVATTSRATSTGLSLAEAMDKAPAERSSADVCEASRERNGESGEIVTVSQALMTDTTLFNSSQLMRVLVEQHEKHKSMPQQLSVPFATTTTTTTTGNRHQVNSNPKTVAAIAAIPECDSPAENCNDSKALQRIMLFRRLAEFSYFHQLQFKHIERYELATTAINERYMEAVIESNGHRTHLNGNILPGLFAFYPERLVQCVMSVLTELEEFHYKFWKFDSVSNDANIQERVMQWFLHTSPGFTHCLMTFDDHCRDRARCVPITSHGNGTSHRPHRPLHEALNAQILQSIIQMKSEFTDQ